MPKNHIAMIGLAVMGANLARNIASRGYSVAVYNRTKEVTEEFVRKYGGQISENVEHGFQPPCPPQKQSDFPSYQGDKANHPQLSGGLSPYYSLSELVDSLESPRKVMIMVKAGSPVDAVIDELIPLLSPEDIIIDCGNSHYQDTIRREKMFREKNIRFVGCGVSGGEEGALHGPSIMPGCDADVYTQLSPILEQIAARDFSGNACVTHTGTDGAGHYVKMVHNGIEYAVMQMIAEAYEVYRKTYGLTAPEIGTIFDTYNTGVLDSYLIEITGKVLARKDILLESDTKSPPPHLSRGSTETGYIVDKILDRAGAKGTGLWTSIDALESGMSVSSIVEATFARMISSDKSLRTKLGAGYEFPHPTIIPLESMKEKMEYTLYLGMLFAYAQGLALIRQRSNEHHWDIDLSEVTRIWQGGCIIRSQILTFLTDAFRGGKDVEHIFALAPIHDAIHEHLSTYQETVSALIQSNIATPALSSALQYFIQMVTIDSSANMIQGLRDYFGAHTYERVDQEGVFHTDWSE